MNELISKALSALKSNIDFKPEIALVLGSGLGNFADIVENKICVSYDKIEGMPVSTVPGHNGRFVFGELEGKKVVIMQGRVHFYEGYDIEQVVLPIRLMYLMGAKKLILTNAAGGINYDFNPGDLMMITDHISSFVKSPLIGPNDDELGDRFPDMSQVYSVKLQNIIETKAKELDIDIKKGVYLQTTGPNYETPAEIKMYRTLGADAVGMSTACEAMTARHLGMEIAGISCITNMASGMNKTPLNHKEVAEIANISGEKFTKLVKAVIQEI